MVVPLQKRRKQFNGELENRQPLQAPMNPNFYGRPVTPVDGHVFVRQANFWRDYLNPLRALTITQAVYYLEQGERGAYAELQWCYRFIEKRDPVLKGLLERYDGGLLKLDWNIKLKPENLWPANATEAMALAQQTSLREAYDRIDNIRDTLAALIQAEFRGFSLLEKYRGKDGMIEHFEPVPQWYWCRPGSNGLWTYNRNADNGRINGEAVELDNFLIREIDRPINEIALINFVFSNMCKKDWAGFIETYGIPAIFIVGPEKPSKEREEKFQEFIEKAIADARGYLPYGTDIKFAEPGHPGTNPFKELMNFLREETVLAGTGGKLTMLTESGSGTLAGGAHQSAWDEIVQGKAARLSEFMQRHFDKPEVLDRQFEGQPALAYWELEARQQMNSRAIIEEAVMLGQAGYKIEVEQLEEKTGYELEAPSALPPRLLSSGEEPGNHEQLEAFLNRDDNADEDGRWVTIRGTPIFIKEGESVKAAIESKFQDKASSTPSKNKEAKSGSAESSKGELERLKEINVNIASHTKGALDASKAAIAASASTHADDSNANHVQAYALLSKSSERMQKAAQWLKARGITAEARKFRKLAKDNSRLASYHKRIMDSRNIQNRIIRNRVGQSLEDRSTEQYAAALVSDMTPLRERLNILLTIQDEQVFYTQAKELMADLDRLKTDILKLPTGARVLADMQITEIANAMEQGAKGRKPVLLNRDVDEEEGGRWVTMRGSPVLIKKGESAADAAERAFGGKEKGEGESKAGGIGKSASAKVRLQPVKRQGDRIIMPDGKDAPEHIHKLKLPPAWRDVQVNPDPKADLQATGIDSKDRKQYVYSETATMRQAAIKFARNQELLTKEQAIAKENAGNIASSNKGKSEPAHVLALIHATGIRPGSESETGAKVQAYGATTLEGRHVVFSGKITRLKFVGKKGVNIDLTVEDDRVASILRERKKQAGEQGKLFAVSDSDLREYTDSLDGGGFKPKDFRTLKGTATALEEVKSLKPANSMAEYKKMVMGVAKKVAAKLGNTPSIALKSYINPFVFQSLKPAEL